MKRTHFFFVTLGILLASASSSSASQCVLISTEQQAAAPIVVEGSFLAGPTLPPDSKGRTPLASPARFRVTEYLRGNGPVELRIRLDDPYISIWAEAGDKWRWYLEEIGTEPLKPSYCHGFSFKGPNPLPPYPPSRAFVLPAIVVLGLAVSIFGGWAVARSRVKSEA